MTILRVLFGFSLGTIVGLFLGVLTARFPALEHFLLPFRGLLRTIPVTSVILLFLLWVSSGMVAIWISMLMVIPVVWAQTSTAIKQADPCLIEMTKAFRFTAWQRIRHIYVPTILPYFIDASTTALGFAWKAGVAAEILSLPRAAIGQKLYLAKISLETADLFAWTVCVVLISLAMEKLILLLSKRLKNGRTY